MSYDFSVAILLPLSEKTEKQWENFGMLELSNRNSTIWQTLLSRPDTVINGHFISVIDILCHWGSIGMERHVVNRVRGVDHFPCDYSSPMTYFMGVADCKYRLCFESRRHDPLNIPQKELSWYLYKALRKCEDFPGTRYENACRAELVYDYFYWTVENIYTHWYQSSKEKKDFDPFNSMEVLANEMTSFDLEKMKRFEVMNKRKRGFFDHAPLILLKRLSTEKVVPDRIATLSRRILYELSNDSDSLLLEKVKTSERRHIRGCKNATEKDIPSERAVNSLLSWLSLTATRDASTTLAHKSFELAESLEHWISEKLPKKQAVQSDYPSTALSSSETIGLSQNEPPTLYWGIISSFFSWLQSLIPDYKNSSELELEVK